MRGNRMNRAGTYTLRQWVRRELAAKYRLPKRQMAEIVREADKQHRLNPALGCAAVLARAMAGMELIPPDKREVPTIDCGTW